MGLINILDFSVANLIAAGEVVERPASVVKELLENAIDAGSDFITVEIQHGGVSYIRVTDNGCGMTPEDLPVSLKRHATSKIRTSDDLDSILTLGFRGEALAAISAVSDIRILSKTKDAPTGSQLSASGGTVLELSECGCPAGTTVIVEHLFANVPARRKFLKKDATETLAVSAVVEKVALSRPEIAFRFIADGVTKFATSGDGILLNAIYAVLGREFASKLIELKPDDSGRGLGVSGFIGRPDTARANRNFQNVFINGRYIRSKTVSAALEQAYTAYIPAEKFPACVLFLTLRPETVDVNVHPSKLEVKFSDERIVFESVYYAVRSALEKEISRPELSVPKEAVRQIERDQTVHAFAPIKDRTASAADADPQIRVSELLRAVPGSFKPVGEGARVSITRDDEPSDPVFPSNLSGAAEITVSADPSVPGAETAGNADLEADAERQEERTDAEPGDAAERPVSETDSPKPDTAEMTETLPEEETEPYRVLGILFDCYIIVECADKAILIDKHAAHERMIFEQLKENLSRTERSAQLLLLPLEIPLSPLECAALEDYASECEKTGFRLTFEKQSSVTVSEIPSCLETGEAETLLVSIADGLSGGTAVPGLDRDRIYEKMLFQASCKAAVKAGRWDGDETVKQIADAVMRDPKIRFCPHGRPVALEMTKRDFDKQFSRI